LTGDHNGVSELVYYIDLVRIIFAFEQM